MAGGGVTFVIVSIPILYSSYRTYSNLGFDRAERLYEAMSLAELFKIARLYRTSTKRDPGLVAPGLPNEYMFPRLVELDRLANPPGLGELTHLFFLDVVVNSPMLTRLIESGALTFLYLSARFPRLFGWSKQVITQVSIALSTLWN